MTRYETREHAVTSYGNFCGRYRREMSSVPATQGELREMREMLRRGIDLADLPDDLADLYAHSDRAWNRFLNDIIRYAARGRL